MAFKQIGELRCKMYACQTVQDATECFIAEGYSPMIAKIMATNYPSIPFPILIEFSKSNAGEDEVNVSNLGTRASEMDSAVRHLQELGLYV